MNAAVDAGKNIDNMNGWGSANQQQARWRHGKNNQCNFLFCDGHVSTMRYKSQFETDLKRRNIYVSAY